MNISRIQKMAVEGDFSIDALRYFLDCHGECEHLDFKEIIDVNDERQATCLAKDLVGMKNVGGGFIVIGVEDKTWRPIGMSRPLGLDTKQLRDLVRKYTGLDIECYSTDHYVNVVGKELLLGLLGVRSSGKISKLKTPSMCKVSSNEREKWGVRNGDIYIREGDQTKRLNDLTKWQEKLEDLQDKYLEADQIEATLKPSPFEVENGLYRLLPREYGSFVGREELLNKVKTAIEKDSRLWIINLYGPGGVGKSALATRIAYEYYESRKFEAILHLSAKDKELSARQGIRPLSPSLISIEDFIDRILRLFSFEECCSQNLEEKKKMVHELLSMCTTLIILDNMETVSDGRIMEFVREFPIDTKAKVLLTSRQRSIDWEMPIQVPELSFNEVKEFLNKRTQEMALDFPIHDDKIIQKVIEISGGLPLAIQWILGDYARTKDLDSILRKVLSNQSPLLEFSFRNSWATLESDVQKALAVLSMFDSPPTLQEWRTVLDWPIEKTEKAKTRLVESTFVTERSDPKTGNKIYIALPITLSFAKLEFDKMGKWGLEARSRYDSYNQKITLSQEQEYQSEDLFKRFDARTNNQKRAILFARMAEGQMSSMGSSEAEEYYHQALEFDPLSIYTLVSYGKFKAELFDYSSAIGLIQKAVSLVTKKTGFYVYYNLADVYGKTKDLELKIRYLHEAMKYKDNTSPYLFTMAQHSLGVALGKLNRHEEAIKNFDEIIEREMAKSYGPSASLVVAAKTKKISLDRTLPGASEIFLKELINRCKSRSINGSILEELSELLVE